MDKTTRCKRFISHNFTCIYLFHTVTRQDPWLFLLDLFTSTHLCNSIMIIFFGLISRVFLMFMWLPILISLNAYAFIIHSMFALQPYLHHINKNSRKEEALIKQRLGIETYSPITMTQGVSSNFKPS